MRRLHMRETFKRKGYITHDELIELIFQEYMECNQTKYTSLFLSSLSSRILRYRSGLSALAILQSFPKHSHTVKEDSSINKSMYDKMSDDDKEFVVHLMPCAICSSMEKINLDNEYWELTEECFSDVGGLVDHDLFSYYYFLRQSNKLEWIQPVESDFKIFSEILSLLINAEEKDNVRTIQSKIGKIKGFKSNQEQRHVLLETLGYCGILETPEHKGLRQTYTNLGTAPRKSHSSDWNYPVDYWLGKNGINKANFKFWFGEYKELEPYWK